MSSLESENQVLRQQALVESTNEDMSEEIKRLVSTKNLLNQQNQVLQIQLIFFFNCYRMG